MHDVQRVQFEAVAIVLARSRNRRSVGLAEDGTKYESIAVRS
jgi:hypothetical protein